jgi:hypothetical protein
MTTIAQQLHEEGRVKGREEGRVDLLCRALELKFGPVPETLLTRARQAKPDEVEMYLERALRAQRIEQVFEGKSGSLSATTCS